MEKEPRKRIRLTMKNKEEEVEPERTLVENLLSEMQGTNIEEQEAIEDQQVSHTAEEVLFDALVTVLVVSLKFILKLSIVSGDWCSILVILLQVYAD